MKKLKFSALAAFLLSSVMLSATPLQAAPGDAANGLEIYNKRCTWCHGVEGDGQGAAVEYLNPPPRDFTSGLYKIKTTHFDDAVPNDDDIYRMIKDGMPGTAMPGWSDILNEKEMWDLVAQIKVFSEYQEEKPENQVEFGSQVATSPDSIAKGKPLYIDRCAECHGDDGKGDGIKKLKGDAEERTWPRNLTKPWTFRGSNGPKDIYTRISTGIPGTQMPSFADPISKKKLSVEERWHVANYAASLAKTVNVPMAENTVIKAGNLEGDLPMDPNDARWDALTPSSFFTLPQIIGKERFFTPSTDSVTVKAVFNDKELAILLEWDDRTKSIPGDAVAASIADDTIYQDAIAVQLPLTIPEGMEKPYFAMGDKSKPVNVWWWKSGTTTEPETVALVNAMGAKNIEPRESAGLTVKSVYSKGSWKVVMKRALTTAESDKDLQFETGRFIPIAFSAWDGSNSETGSKHTMTTWYWLLLKPPASSKPLVTGVLVGLFLFGGLSWWAKSAGRKENT
jgi:DMSO reductase family type II enzyme heme b subunit